MSQNLINDLTDRVSSLQARLNAVEAEARTILRTAEGEMARANRAEAEANALAERLSHTLWTHDDSMGDAEIKREIEEIRIEARNQVSPLSEERRLAEWLAAIRTELTARGREADRLTVLSYAESALDGDVPHWLTPEYITKVSDPRLNR
jgi:uncharacterized coiled-coil DUF342 family protein